MMKDCAAVFDIGTSSLKAGLADKNGCMLFFSRLFFPAEITGKVWFCSFKKLFKELCFFAQTNKLHIAGICISGNGPSIVAINKKENKEKLLMWNIKPDFVPPVKTDSIFLPRFLLFKQFYKGFFDKADFFLSGQEYLVYKMTGKVVTVLPERRYEPAYWTKEEAFKFSIPYEKLPPFVNIGEKAGTYCGIPVFCGAPDFVAALIGTNTLQEGKACDRAGSSEGFNICIKKIPQASKLKGLRLLPSPLGDLWKLSFHINDSGKLFFDLIKKYNKTDEDFNCIMNEISDFIKNHSLPYKAVLKNSLPEEGFELIKSITEKIKKGLTLLEEASGFTPEYVLSGGQAKNEIWTQLKADITGRTFVLLNCADAELLGNAAIVFSSLKQYSSIFEAAGNMSRPVKKFFPVC